MFKLVKIWPYLFAFVLVLLGSDRALGQCPSYNPIMGPTLVCPGATVTYQVTHDYSSTNTFKWELNGAGTIMSPTTGISITVKWQNVNSGPFTIICTEREGNCYFENSMEVQIADDLLRYPFNCFSHLNMSFDGNCEMLVQPHHLLPRGTPDCPESFVVELSLDGAKSIPNPVTIAYLGKTILAKIKHRETGAGCTTLITLKDGTPPQLFCENDTTYCSDSSIWNPFDTVYKRPIAIDNCADLVPVEEQGYEWINLIEHPEFSAYVVRTWSAVDNYDNKGRCQDTIFLKRVVFDEIMCPPDTIISCDSNFDLQDPLTSGVPTFEGHPLYSKNSYCEVEIWYEDEIFPGCGGMYRIKRSWTLKDLVNEEESTLECIQMIHIIDTVGPVITFDTVKVSMEKHPDLPELNPDTFYYTLYSPTLDQGCVAHGYFPKPIVKDSCTSNDSILVSILWSKGHIQYLNGYLNQLLEFKNLSKGKHIITIKAYDLCHNESTDTLILVTQDSKPPYITAEKQPLITLAASSGVTWVDVSVFNEGTYDNCGLSLLLARRADWYQDQALVNLCNDTSLVCVGERNNTFWIANLEEDRHIDEVEAHYYKTLKWLKEDSFVCADIIRNAWIYDLIKHSTLKCNDQPYSIDDLEYKKLFKEANCTSPFEGIDELTNEHIDLWDQIGGGWSDAIPFSCEDACRDEKVVVELLAIDKSCNIARIWVLVEVEDKTTPEIRYKLPDIRISCKAYNEYYRQYVDEGYFDIFGSYVQHDSLRMLDTLKDKKCVYGPFEHGEHYKWEDFLVYDGVVFDNCGVEIRESQKIYFENCGNGWIERHFVFKGSCSSSEADSIMAVQKIEIYPDCPLQYYDINWPAKDTTVYGCGLIKVKTKGPELRFHEPCRDIGIGYYDLVVNVNSGDSICTKIIRKWAVIDWCQQEYPKYSTWIGNDLYQYFEYEQIIFIKNNVYPVIQGCDLDTLCIGASCNYDLDTTLDPSDDCTPAKDLVVSWSLYKNEDYGYYHLKSGNSVRAQADDLETGLYKLIWSVTDHCHNTSHCVDYFTVRDCIKPTPVCLTSTTVKLVPVDRDKNGSPDTAIGKIWAAEVNVSSYDNCQSDIVDFRIRWKGTGSTDAKGNIQPPPAWAVELSLGCNDVGTRTAEMWAVDEWGNAAYCDLIVSVQPPPEGCPSEDGKIRGQVVNINGTGIPEVQLTLDDGQTIMEEISTQQDGSYEFSTRLEHGKTLTITPEKSDDPLNGISTLDLIKMSKHILSKEPFHSAMQFKTADVSGDGDVSVTDLIVLRKLILGKITELPTDKIWYFFNVDDQPYSHISRTINYRNYLYFSGVKIGDLTGDAVKITESSRGNEAFEKLQFYDKYAKPGEWIRIPFYLPEVRRLDGLQLALKTDPNKIGNIEIKRGQINLNPDHTGIDYSDIRVAWFEDETQGLSPGEPLFYLEGYMVAGAHISDAIALNDQSISNELYYGDNPYPLRLLALNHKMGINLSQNYPNPFQELTKIDIKTGVSGRHRFAVVDQFGKLVIQKELWLSAGEETITIIKSDLNTPGIYYYSIENDHDKQVKKLIFTD